MVYLVIPNHLLASAYPGEKDPDAPKILTRQIIDAGVEVLVNVMEIEELKSCTSVMFAFWYQREGVIIEEHKLQNVYFSK